MEAPEGRARGRHTNSGGEAPPDSGSVARQFAMPVAWFAISRPPHRVSVRDNSVRGTRMRAP